MSARITVHLDHVHPVIGSRWHRVKLHHMPAPGDKITTCCGLTEPVTYDITPQDAATATTCWSCDLIYRREHGIDILPDHPGLPSPRPRPDHGHPPDTP